MAVDIPPWAVKAIDKIRRGFLWRGRKDVKGGHCLVAWPKVCLPKELGGLAISNIQNVCWVLRMRWLWLQKSDPGRPWGMFQLQIHKNVKAFFSMVVVAEDGNGARTLFWSDKWIHGQRVADIAPQVFAIVPKRRMKRRMVLEALTNPWVSELQGALTAGVINEFLGLWDVISAVILQ